MFEWLWDCPTISSHLQGDDTFLGTGFFEMLIVINGVDALVLPSKKPVLLDQCHVWSHPVVLRKSLWGLADTL